jgi:hypothetical protein
MANFQTHLYGGIVVSGGAVLILHGSGLVSDGQTLMLFGLGVMGSLLPDIDADASAPVRAFFGILGAALAFAWTLPLIGRYSPLNLGVVWIGSFLAVRVLLCEAFARLTVHRGIWHSLLAAVFTALAAVNLLHWLLGQAVQAAWVGGLMVGVGYLAHLVLDEACGVDLLGVRVRRSFGTALKPWSYKDPASSLAMAAAVALVAWLAPPSDWGPGRERELDWSPEPLTQAVAFAAQAAERLWMLLDWR